MNFDTYLGFIITLLPQENTFLSYYKVAYRCLYQCGDSVIL